MQPIPPPEYRPNMPPFGPPYQPPENNANNMLRGFLSSFGGTFGVLIAIIAICAVVCAGCAGLYIAANQSPQPDPTPAPGASLSSDGTNQTTSQQTGQQQPRWHSVYGWTAVGDAYTPNFTTPQTWRLAWSCEPGNRPNDIDVIVNAPNTDTPGPTTTVTCGPGHNHGLIDMSSLGAGTYWVLVHSSGQWDLSAEFYD